MTYISRFCKNKCSSGVIVVPTVLCPKDTPALQELSNTGATIIRFPSEGIYGHVIQVFTKDTLMPTLTRAYSNKLIQDLNIYWVNRMFNNPKCIYETPYERDQVSYLMHLPAYHLLKLNIEESFSSYWEFI